MVVVGGSATGAGGDAGRHIGWELSSTTGTPGGGDNRAKGPTAASDGGLCTHELPSCSTNSATDATGTGGGAGGGTACTSGASDTCRFAHTEGAAGSDGGNRDTGGARVTAGKSSAGAGGGPPETTRDGGTPLEGIGRTGTALPKYGERATGSVSSSREASNLGTAAGGGGVAGDGGSTGGVEVVGGGAGGAGGAMVAVGGAGNAGGAKVAKRGAGGAVHEGAPGGAGGAPMAGVIGGGVGDAKATGGAAESRAGGGKRGWEVITNPPASSAMRLSPLQNQGSRASPTPLDRPATAATLAHCSLSRAWASTRSMAALARRATRGWRWNNCSSLSTSLQLLISCKT